MGYVRRNPVKFLLDFDLHRPTSSTPYLIVPEAPDLQRPSWVFFVSIKVVVPLRWYFLRTIRERQVNLGDTAPECIPWTKPY